MEFSRRPEFCNSPSSKFEKFFQSMLIIRIEKLPPSWWLGLTTVLTRLQYESNTFQQSCPGFNWIKKNQSKTFQQLVAHDQTFLFKCLIDNNFDFKLGGFSSATSKLTNSQWKASSNSWNKFEIQAFEQIGNDKKAQIHVLFRQNLEKRFVVFWLRPEIACY